MDSTPILRLFGRPCIGAGKPASAPVALPNERRARVLLVLALHAGQWVLRVELARLLWPALARERSLANVRKALHLAREWPFASALEVGADAVRWPIATDLLAARNAARDGRLAQALAACDGTLLDGFDDGGNAAWSEWLEGERALCARDRQRWAHARLAQLADEPDEAARLARDLLAAEALDEDAMVALLAALRTLERHDELREAYRAYAQRLDEELGIEPSARVRDLLQISAAAARAPAMVGRQAEFAAVVAAMSGPPCRVLTVIGPGGAGKSTLLKAALRRIGGEPAPLWLPLDDLTDAAQASARLATELAAAPAPRETPQQAALRHLGSAPRLLVLDNCEHLPGLAPLVEQWLAAHPQVRVLASSRTRLGVGGERLLPLAGLAVPEPGAGEDRQRDSEAVRLFVAAARQARADFEGRGQWEAIAELVRALGGMPLAILLAAHWVRWLPVVEIVEELANSLEILQADDDGEERAEHRSLRATFESSWRRLGPNEQRALAALSVFAGSFPRAAALEVSGGTLPVLASLADKSFLQFLPHGRIGLHPLVRRYVQDQTASAERAAAEQRHARWHLAQLARLGQDADARAASEAIDADLENHRLAWRWAAARQQWQPLAAAGAALLRHFELRARAAEGLAWWAELDLPRHAEGAAIEPLAHLLGSCAHLEYRCDRLDSAQGLARLALRKARAAGRGFAHGPAVLRPLNVLALCEWQVGRPQQAQRLLRRSLAVARALGDERSIGIALGNLSSVEQALGHLDSAGTMMREVLQRQRAAGDWVGVAVRLSSLAHLALERRNAAEAVQWVEEGLHVCEQHHVAFVRPHLLVNLAIAHTLAGRLDQAAEAAELTVSAARTEANRGVECQALLQLVRIDTRRGASDAALPRLRLAVTLARETGRVPVLLDTIFCHAEWLAARGRRTEAIARMRWYVARPEIAPGDRSIAREALLALQAQAAAPAAGAQAPVEAASVDSLIDELMADGAAAGGG